MRPYERSVKGDMLKCNSSMADYVQTFVYGVSSLGHMSASVCESFASY